MEIHDNILETIGNTPLVRLHQSVRGIPGMILAKVETFNPGHSIKDRMALKMLLDAESSGLLKPGGTIIECTSGNTGMGLAIAACVRGYRCIFTTSDKQSKEKIDILKAVGAEVIVCPTNVSPEDDRSYYSVARRLSEEIPNSWWANQYDNLSNTAGHYESTGPEIWRQTDGKITHLVVGVGTGGTISGTGKYLREQNPDIKIWGIDTYGSVFKKYHETGIFDEKEIYPYITEGIGEDILPANVDFNLIDRFVKVSDRDGALAARRLAQEEGILLGYSAGSALAGLHQLRDELTEDDIVVLIFHDHGSRYVGKIYNDDWMRERGFLDRELLLADIITGKEDKRFITIPETETLKNVLDLMKMNDISQLPVMREGQIVGSVTDRSVLNKLLDNPAGNTHLIVREIMDEPFPELAIHTPSSELSQHINREVPAIITKDLSGAWHIVTQYDLIQAL